MKVFEIYVNGDDVACNTPLVIVPANRHESFPVYLQPGLESKYTLDNLDFGANKGGLSQKRLNGTAIMLHAINTAPGVHKFTVKLTPKKKTKNAGENILRLMSLIRMSDNPLRFNWSTQHSR